MTFPQAVVKLGKEGDSSQRKNKQSREQIVQSWDRVLVPPQGTHITTSLSSAGAKAPTQMEGSNFRLSTGFLEHHPVTLSPTNQKKVTHCTLTGT